MPMTLHGRVQADDREEKCIQRLTTSRLGTTSLTCGGLLEMIGRHDPGWLGKPEQTLTFDS